MTITYESVVPWGRSFEEYVAMFHLTETDLNKTILGCGDGPASFNSLMTRSGKKVVSVDPLYQLDADLIEKRIAETYPVVIDQTRQNRDKFNWTTIKNVEELGQIRMTAMRDFLEDFPVGRQAKRYVAAQLPILPFADQQFKLALSSHFLFLYSDNLSLEFHIAAIREMLRVAREVRIFPVLDVNAICSPYVDAVIASFQSLNYSVEEVQVDYEFQKGGNLMLKIIKGLL